MRSTYVWPLGGLYEKVIYTDICSIRTLSLCGLCFSNDEIRSIVKPCIDKIVSSVEGSGDGFTDDDLIKCASDLTRQNNKISISKAIAIVGFYAGEAYKPLDDTSINSKGTYSGNSETPRT